MFSVEATKAVEEAVSSNRFTIVIKDDGPPNGRKHRKPETVATIEFPGYYQFTLKIDRTEGQGMYILCYLILFMKGNRKRNGHNKSLP